MRPLIFAFVLLCGCESQNRRQSPTAPDRDTTAAITRVRAIPGVSTRLRPDSQLVPATLGVKLDTPLKGGLETIVPLSARASMRIARDASRTLDISAEHTNDTKGLIDTGAMVFVQPTPDVDVLLVSEPTRVTELRVLRSTAAPKTASWAFHRSDGLGPLRVVGNTIEVPAANGTAWLVSDAIELVDSAGDKRPVTLRVEDDRVTVSYETNGLKTPAALVLAWNERQP